MKVWLQSYTPALGHTIPLFQGSVFFSFWDALYTRNRDSERSMINATTRERRFGRRLQRRFDYGYWNMFLLLHVLGKVINAPWYWQHGQSQTKHMSQESSLFYFFHLYHMWRIPRGRHHQHTNMILENNIVLQSMIHDRLLSKVPNWFQLAKVWSFGGRCPNIQCLWRFHCL